MSFPSPLHLSPLRGLAVYDQVQWALLLSISGSSLEAGLGWGRGSDGKGEGGRACRELGPAAPRNIVLAATAISLAEAASGEMPLRVTCWPSAQLQMLIASITLVWNQAFLMSAVGWLVGMQLVWGSWGCVQREVQCGKIRRGRDKPSRDRQLCVAQSGGQPGGCLTPVSWVEEEPPAQEACPPGKRTSYVHVPGSSSAALPAMPPGLPPSSQVMLRHALSPSQLSH